MADEPLGRMIIELGLDDSEFGKGLQGAQRKAKYAMAEMKSNMSFMSAWGNQTQVLQTKMTGLSRAIEAQAGVVKKQREQFENSRTKLGEATGATGKYATQLQNATAKLNSLQGQLRKTAGELAVVQTKTQGITGVMNKVGTAATALGSKLSSIGKAATTGLTIPIAAGLGYAAKSAIDFNSQIAALGPLLTNGEAVTGRFKTQLNQLGDSSLKWSKQYGLSTTEINEAMSELVKRGYNANQVIGAMPSILNATKASGEGMGTVMQATASIVEQFGLTSKTTAGAMKNTQLVADSLTYAANATAAGFGDLSEAMSFVGPVAHSLGLSVQETAAAIGALSQQGIEGQKAGTGLRGILTSLIKPTKSQDEAFRSMGISTKRLQEDSHNLPQLIADIQKGTEHASKAERGRALALAFGKQQQSAANALVEYGSTKLRELTKATNESGGATKRVADQLNDTQANKVKRFQMAVQALSISFGQKLLPTLMPIVEDVTQLINQFSKLDSNTQQLILRLGLGAAAFGPLALGAGKVFSVFGKFNTGIVGVIGSIKKFVATHRQLSDVTEALGGLGGKATSTERAFKPLGDTVGKTVGKFTVSGSAASAAGDKLGEAANVATKAGGSFTLFGKALTVSAGEAGVLGTALTPLGAGIAVATLAVGAGITAWELWGKKAYENSVETGRWGTTVGRTADSSLQKFQNFNTEASQALAGFSTSAKASAKEASDAFTSMYRTIHQSAKDTNSQLQKSLNGLPSSVRQYLQGSINEQKKANNEATAEARQLAKNVNSIRVKASKENRDLTADESQYILNGQKRMNDLEVETLNVSAAKKRTILRALNGDIKGLSNSQLFDMSNTLSEALDKENQKYAKQKSIIEDLYNSGKISADKYASAMRLLDDNHSQMTDQMVANLYKVLKATGDSSGQIERSFKAMGISMGQVNDALRNTAKTGSTALNNIADTASKMSSTAKKAGETWNSIVLNPKTGEVKTNLQKVLNDTAKTDAGWKKLRFAAKNAKISSNARAEIGIAAIENGRWEHLSWSDKYAMIRNNADATMVQVLETNGKWNTLTFKQKEAIISAKGGKELSDAVFQAGIWNSLNLKDIEAMVTTKGVSSFIDALDKMKIWQGLTPKEQFAIVQTKGTAGLADLILKYGGWQRLPDTEKKVLMNDSQFMSELQRDAESGNSFAAKELLKIIGADNTGFNQGMSNANAAANSFGKTPAKKPIDADTKPLDTKFKNLLSPNYFGSKPATVPVDANTTSADSKITATKKNASGKVTLKVDPKNSIETISGVANAIKKVPNRKPDINVNGHDSKSKAEGIHRAIKGIPNRNPDVNLNGHGSREKAAGIRDTIKQIPVRKDSDIYITTHKTTITETRHKRAGGDDNFVGGDAIVNDQSGSTFRELIHLPNGRAFIPHGRNVLLRNLPKATKIVPAPTTAKMFKGLPQFANGLNIPENATPVRIVRDLTDRIANSGTSGLSIAQSIVAGNTDNNNGKLIDEMVKGNAMLQYIITLLTPMSSGADTPAPINTNQVLRALASALGPYSHYISANSKRTGGLI